MIRSTDDRGRTEVYDADQIIPVSDSVVHLKKNGVLVAIVRDFKAVWHR